MPISSARPRREPPGQAASARTPLKVMIVDDSITARTVHSRIVSADDEMAVAAIAGTAEQAIFLLGSIKVDVILLDLEMPGIGGLDALPRIIEAAKGARIMVVSALTVDGAEQTLAALSLGAADTLPKPVAGRFDQGYRDTLLAKVRALGRASLRIAPASAPAVRSPRLRAGSGRKAAILGIGASTGGIHSLGQLFGALPRAPTVPILVTQHLPGSFMPVFARQLNVVSGCEALVAEDDMEVLPSRILIAPGDGHLTVRRHGARVLARIDRKPAASGCTPSVDPMFASLAEAFGADTLGVVLSGMGRDGAVGAGRIVEAGGAIFAQDEASCAVWGMPRAVAEAGLASAILPPDQIGSRIAASLQGPGSATSGRSAAWT
ncbi:MAG: chemotaxis-specific protein-glutamate methyltransferase CheB [Novosphingobium sp.]